MPTPELDRIPGIEGSLTRSQEAVANLPQLGPLNSHEISSAMMNTTAYGLSAANIAVSAPPGLASSYLKDQPHSSPNGMSQSSSGLPGHQQPAPARVSEPYQLPPGHGFISHG